jgi:hypothetical protein
MELPEYFRPYAADGDAQQGTRAQADKGAKLLVGAREQGAEGTSGGGNGECPDNPQQNGCQAHRICRLGPCERLAGAESQLICNAT